MRNFFVLVSALFALASCAGAMRYSAGEIKSFTPAVQERIKGGEISFGMTPLQVRYAWGSPSVIKVQRVEGDRRLREEWIYRRLLFFKSVVVFTDGEVTEMISKGPAFGSYKMAQ